MKQSLEFKAEIEGHGVVTVVVSADKDGGIVVDVESEESTGLDASIGIGKVSKYDYPTATTKELSFADITEEQARGLGVEYLMSRVDECRGEGAFYSIFEDHHRDWTFYNGDGADEEAMMRFLDSMEETIRQARRQVPMQVDMEKYRREHPEKFKEVEPEARPVLEGKPYIF